MAIKLGIQTVSDTQRMYLSQVKLNPVSEGARDSLLQVCADPDITSGRETVHPEWVRIFDGNRERLQSQMAPEAYAELGQALGLLEHYDPEALAIDPKSARIAFLLGAGASKPSPSDIPNGGGTPA